MPYHVSDGLLWITILGGTYYAYRTIPDTLNYVRNLAACPEQTGPGPRKQLQKDAENAIGIDALRVLSGSPSYELRAAIIKITAARVVKSRTKKLLLRDLASKNEKKRYDAICAIWMLLYNPALHGKNIAENFLDYDSFHAIVTALKNVLADHKPDLPSRLPPATQLLYPEPKIPSSPIKPPVRPYHEFSLLMILRILLNTTRPYDQLLEYPDNMTCALAAGLVERWLKYYPFPCALPHNSKYNFKKADVSSLFEYRSWGNDDVLMAGIMINVNMTAMGKKQLRDAGLRGSNHTEIEDIENSMGGWKYIPTRQDNANGDQDVRMTNGESTAGAVTPPPILNRRWTYSEGQPLRTRSQELSHEEEILRRRRREAVVVAEAGTPIGQANILQRTESGTAWQTELEHDDPSVVLNMTVPTPPSSVSRPTSPESSNRPTHTRTSDARPAGDPPLSNESAPSLSEHANDGAAADSNTGADHDMYTFAALANDLTRIADYLDQRQARAQRPGGRRHRFRRASQSGSSDEHSTGSNPDRTSSVDAAAERISAHVNDPNPPTLRDDNSVPPDFDRDAFFVQLRRRTEELRRNHETIVDIDPGTDHDEYPPAPILDDINRIQAFIEQRRRGGRPASQNDPANAQSSGHDADYIRSVRDAVDRLNAFVCHPNLARTNRGNLFPPNFDVLSLLLGFVDESLDDYEETDALLQDLREMSVSFRTNGSGPTEPH